MPTSLSRPPKYCRQKQSGRPDRAYVKINGKRVMLGNYGSPESYECYTEAISGNTKKRDAQVAPTAPTMAMLMADYLDYAIEKYGGESNGEVWDLKGVFRILQQSHGDYLARNFGPKALQAARRTMIEKDWSRKYINEQCQRIKRMVAWGVAEEILPRDARHALDAVPGLSRGEFGARETEPKRPVPQADIDATIPQLSDTVADMVRLMIFTGMRPGELCQLATKHIDRAGEIWLFTPPTHKTQHKGKQRVIPIGPQAQAVLTKYLFTDPCFGYTTASFRRAVRRACERAEVKRWHPNQLRHNAATNIREKLGLEHAQVVLGHSKADVTQIYAEANSAKAIEAARALG